MRVLILHRRGLEPALAMGPRFGALTASESLALDIERNTALGRALARRGHEVHVLADDLELPHDLLPATVHTWRSFGAPASLAQGLAPYNVHLVRSGAAGCAPGEPPFDERCARALRPEVVIADLRAGDAGCARDLAERADAALVLRVPPYAGDDPADGERDLALADAAALVVPSALAERHLRAAGALEALAPSAEVTVLADGLDAHALAPEPRGALPAVDAPPLPPGMRCVLLDGDADQDPLGAALFRASADILVRRVDVGLVLPSRGFVASEARARGSALRTKVFTLDPSERAARAALVRRARLVLLPYEHGARSARRLTACLARGVLPMARQGGAVGEALTDLGALLPADLAEALALPDDIEVDAQDLRRRVTAVLDHPDLPYIGARLAAIALREHDWSRVAQRWERLAARAVSTRALRAHAPRARSA